MLDWWDPAADAGAGGWSPVAGDPGPTFDAVAGCVSATLDNTTTPTISQLTGTVFATASDQLITSVGAADVHAGVPFSLHVTTSGSPTPTMTETGPLPTGVQFHDDLDGTATLSGTPTGATVGGIYTPTFSATYGSGAAQHAASQTFTLFVFEKPAFSSGATVAVKIGASLDFTVRAHGYPPAVITKTGPLPGGVTFTTKNDGTATLSGKPAAGTGGTYPITISADNSAGTTTQKFTLTVLGFHVTSLALPAAKRGKPYATKLAALGGTAPYSWKANSAPPGPHPEQHGIALRNAEADRRGQDLFLHREGHRPRAQDRLGNGHAQAVLKRLRRACDAVRSARPGN